MRTGSHCHAPFFLLGVILSPSHPDFPPCPFLSTYPPRLLAPSLAPFGMLENNEGLQLQVISPVDGEVVAVNPVYLESPGSAISESDAGEGLQG